MLKNLPLVILIIFCSCKAQDKIKGSRNVKTEQYDLTSFHSIQAQGEFKIGVLKGSRPMVEIKADDNLHDYILTEVKDGVLYIKPLKEFGRTKKQELTVSFSDTLQNILIAEDVEMESLQDLYTGDFKLETKEGSKAFMTIKSNAFRLIQSDNSRTELNITAQATEFQLNQSANVKALVNSPVYNVDIYEKASARIEGDIMELNLRADQSSKFDGENLSCLTAEVLAQGSSDLKVNVKDTLNIRANGRSEIEIYNEPQINLIEFTNEAKIEKKEFSKGLFQ